jgi:RNA polymerase sigma-70 factor (ECF subfamily)
MFEREVRMSSSPTHSDADLLRLMLAGDEDAFTALYRRRQGGIYRFALQMSGSAAVAEDVVQEVFLALMREGHRFDSSRASLAAYLYGIARNQVLRVFERERTTVALSDGDEGETTGREAFTTSDDPLGDLTRAEAIEQLRNAVLALPPHYREVVVLCELHEMSYLEAAGALDCAVGTVRSRLHRARSMLVEKMRARSDESAKGESREENAARTAMRTARCFA